MTSRTPYVPPEERAHSVGATGGLPGANADPRASELAPSEIESTVAAGDMPGDAAPDPADVLGGAGSEPAESAPRGAEGGDLARREGDLDADGGEADAEASTQAGLS
jgi:hypothetical protein